MHNHHRERRGAVRLPVAVAQHPYAGLDLDEPLLRSRQLQAAREKKTSQRLGVSSPQQAPRAELIVALSSSHAPILYNS